MKSGLGVALALALLMAHARVHASEPVPVATTIEATSEVRDIRLSNGAVVRALPGTRARVRGSVLLPAERGQARIRGPHVELLQGGVEVRVAPEPATAVLVTTPHGAMVTAWRGSAHVRVGEDATGIAVHQGAVQVGAVDRWTTLFTGNGAVVRRRGRPDAKVIMPSAPVWKETAGGVVVGDAKTSVRASWAPVSGAAGYVYQVAQDRDFSELVAAGEVVAAGFTSAALSGGAYWARVSAVTSEGLLGGWSEPRAIHVLHVNLPPHAFAARDGAIVLPAGAAVTLDRAEGAQWASSTYRAARVIPETEFVFGPAPRQIKLGDEPFRIVRIREASGAMAQFTLVARSVRAKVESWPERPRWPDHRVRLVVRAYDPSGRSDPAAEELSFITHLGIEELKLAWTKSGATWTAELPSRVPPGPWVVRVQVKDSIGSQVGAGVIDIDGPTLAPVPQQRARGAETTTVRMFRR